MKKDQIKLGDKVKAVFRKYGKHIIIGTVFEISEDKHALNGTWVSIKVTGENMNDPHVGWLVKNNINVLVPISDVKEVIK